ncbi:MAG: hypothetical protein KGY66_08040, partial [Candidatus Thermoplasmatota archaeon]|nr:hypothetical protein [Candidatus Thermoplasmatota archaeon]
MVKDKYFNLSVDSSDIDMKMVKIFLAIGILLIAGGLVSAFFGVQGLTGSIQDPSNVAIKSLSFDGEGSESKTVELDAGSYDVWVEGEDREIRDLSVEGEEGNSVFEETTVSHNISIGGRSYEKVGDLEISEDGNYTFTTEEECTLHVTEPISGAF